MHRLILILLTLFSHIVLAAPTRSRIAATETEFAQEETIPLPEGLIAVQYLESTGEEWITTDFNISEDDNIDIEYRNVTAINTTGRHLQGWRTLGASYWGSNNGYYDRLGASPRIPCGEGDVVRIIRNGTPGLEDICTINGEVNWRSSAYSKYSGTLDLFALGNSGNYRGAWRVNYPTLKGWACKGNRASLG